MGVGFGQGSVPLSSFVGPENSFYDDEKKLSIRGVKPPGQGGGFTSSPPSASLRLFLGSTSHSRPNAGPPTLLARVPERGGWLRRDTAGQRFAAPAEPGGHAADRNGRAHQADEGQRAQPHRQQGTQKRDAHAREAGERCFKGQRGFWRH